MIILFKVGDGSGAGAGYNTKKVGESAALLCSTLAQTVNPFQIGREFDAISALRPRVIKPIVHLVMAISPMDYAKGTVLNFTRWLWELQEVMGLQKSQLIAWQHMDRPHPHIHVILNRVIADSSVVSVWGLNKKIQNFVEMQRHRHGLNGVTKKDFLSDFPQHEMAKVGLRSFSC
jgi:Relaxase/Mobilisation nuclease domain